MAAVFKTIDLTKTFPASVGEGAFFAIDRINLSLEENEFISIIGPSGSGKSTLMRILSGILEPTSGKVLFGEGIENSRAIVFQNSNLLPWFSTLDNIALPLMVRGEKKERAREEAGKLLKMIGLEEFSQEWPMNLSGGMAQRVALARALIENPKLLLMDEPFGALDAITREQLALELLGYRERLNSAVVMVTHSISEALLLSDRVLVFSGRPGRIIDEVRVPFERPRDASLRETPAFFALTARFREKIMRG